MTVCFWYDISFINKFLTFRAASKDGTSKLVTIRKLQEGKERKKDLENWIDDIWEMHR